MDETNNLPDQNRSLIPDALRGKLHIRITPLTRSILALILTLIPTALWYGAILVVAENMENPLYRFLDNNLYILPGSLLLYVVAIYYAIMTVRRKTASKSLKIISWITLIISLHLLLFLWAIYDLSVNGLNLPIG